MQFKISAYATALFSSWYFIHEMGILFDAGDGVVAHLLAKTRKIKHIFISHPDRDHLLGIFQILQLNAREGGWPKIYYPKHSGSFVAMEKFAKAFDQQVELTQWIPVEAGDEIQINKDLSVKIIGNNHFPILDGKVKCFSFHLIERRSKLKTEFLNMEAAELIKIKADKGDSFITNEVEKVLLSYSADTKVEFDGRWDQTEILIHEATFLDPPDGTIIQERFNKHSVLGDVIKMVAATNVRQLILGHFSTRYSAKKIDAAIEREYKKYGLTIPVYRIHPGQFLYDVIAKGHLKFD